MLTILLLTIFGAILAAIVGTVWYSPMTPMGRLHMRYVGFDKLSKEEQKEKMEEAKPMMPKMYGIQMGLSLLTAFATVSIITMSTANGVSFGIATGFVVMNWLCFMVPVTGSMLLWGNCDRKIFWKKFFSDVLCNLVTLLIIALVVSFFI